jgi:hypothetical protein
MHPPRRSPVLFALALVASGCGNKGRQSAFTRTTLVSVNPIYLEDAHCGDRPGEMRTYVATLWDTTPFDSAPAYPESDCERNCGLFDQETDELVELIDRADCEAMEEDPSLIPSDRYVLAATNCDWFQLPSSDPVDCKVPVGFSFVAAQHEYMARVEGYERDDLLPLEKGSPILLDPETGARVLPSWVWACTHPAIAVSNWDNPLVDCGLVERPARQTSTTAIEVEPSSLLGELECGDAPDRVGKLQVQLIVEDGDPVVQEIACDQTVTFTELDDKTPLSGGASYFLEVQAYSTGSDRPSWQTSCYADTISGVSVPALCSPLSKIPSP